MSLRRPTKKHQSPPTNPTVYPIGSFLKTEKGYFYIASPNKRYRMISQRLLDSWSPHRVIETSEAAVATYRIVAKMKFRNGSLLHNIGDGKIYLISEGLRRHVTNPDALTLIGAVRKDIVSVSLDEIHLHEIGEELK